MKDHFSKIRSYILELGHTISLEDSETGMMVVEDEPLGIKNLVIGCAEPLLIMEQFIFEMNNESAEVMKMYS